jgi:ribosomal protein L34E
MASMRLPSGRIGCSQLKKAGTIWYGTGPPLDGMLRRRNRMIARPMA